MQGTWKEELGGWNNKGFKRKRQTRNHTLKDKLDPLLSIKYNKSKEIETVSIEPVIVQSILYKDEKEVNYAKTVFLLQVRHRLDFRKGSQGYDEYKEELLEVYFEYRSKTGHNVPIIKSTGQTVVEYLGLKRILEESDLYLDVEKVSIYHAFDLKMVVLKEVDYIITDISDRSGYMVKQKVLYDAYYSTRVFVYGKLVSYHYRYFRQRSSNRFSKKTASGITRSFVRDCIKTDRYDLCVREQYYRGYDWF